MKYIDYRNNINSGDLLAWSHRSWASWYDFKVQMVRVATQSEYCHVGIAWVYSGRVFVIESVIPYVRIVPLSNLLPCYHLSLKPNWTNEVEEYALSLVGQAAYSQLEAIKAYFGKNTSTNSAWQCAELAKVLLRKCGIDLNCRDIPSEVVLEASKLSPISHLEK